MKRIFAALSALIFASPAYAISWTPLLQSTDFDGIKVDMLTAVNGVVLLFLIIVGLGLLLKVFR